MESDSTFPLYPVCLALPMHQKALVFAVLALLPCSTTAQSVWIVDDDGGSDVDSTTITGAIATASDGDLILVRDGSYSGLLTISAKGLSVVADENATVLVSGVDFLQTNGNAGVLIEDLAPTQAVYLRGLSFSGSGGFEPGHHVLLQDNAGSVWIEDCAVTPAAVGIGQDGITAINCKDVTITRCSITPGDGADCAFVGDTPCGNGLNLDSSSVYLFDSDVSAGDSQTASVFFPFFGASAVVQSGGDLYVAGSSLTGGDGRIVSCSFPRNGGGAGLLIDDGDGIARLLDSTTVGGSGADGMGICTDGPDGPDTSVGIGGTLTNLSGTARHFAASSPVDLGADVQLEYQGLPGDLILLGYNAGPASIGIYLPSLRGIVLTVGSSAPVIQFQGTADASGSLSVTIPGGPITISGAFDHFISQPIFVDGSELTVGDPSQIVIVAP